MARRALDHADYWKLVTLCTRLELARKEAALATLTRDVELRRLCARHDLDPDRPITTDDVTCTLAQDDAPVKE